MASFMDEALKKFSQEVYTKVVNSQGECYCNAFLSPVSIYAAMAMVLAGSQGETKREMLTALQLSTDLGDDELHTTVGSKIKECFESTPGVTVSVGNRMFAQENADINPKYKSVLLEKYAADTENVNFATATEAARQRINQWVSEKTKEKIRELFTPGILKPNTCVAITNALYFKGSWEIAFSKEATHEADFYRLDGTAKKVQMMHREAEFKVGFLRDLDSMLVKLPFKESKWEMMIVLPQKKDGLKTLLPSLLSGGLEKIMSDRFRKNKVTVQLPRFKLSENEGIDAKNLLMELGMKAVFSDTQADLSRICSSPPLFVSDVVHKAILEVDEEGATAAAATGVAVATRSLIRKMELIVDHPFFVALVYNDILPIFIGHVVDPEVN